MLKKPCRGVVPQGGNGHVSRLRQLGQGRLPHHLEEWPDQLATPRDARPVDHLRHTGSEWVLDSHVTLVVATRNWAATRPPRGALRELRADGAQPGNFATWDPDSPPHVEWQFYQPSNYPARVQIQRMPIYESPGGLRASEYAHAYLSFYIINVIVILAI